MQLIGPHLSEERLLNIAYTFSPSPSWLTHLAGALHIVQFPIDVAPA